MEHFPDYETVEYHLIYSELIKAARNRGTVTYQELASVVGLPLTGNHMGNRMGYLLGAVSQNEAKHNRPMLSAIAVTASGKVGSGFFKLARDFGLLKSESPEDEQKFLEDQQRKCYATWKQKFNKAD